MSIIGIDYGGRRIGLAVSESLVLATPHSVIANGADLVETIARIGSSLEAEKYVVGIARRARSGAGEAKFREFAERLRQRTCKPVELWDESLSTVVASEQLRASGRSSRDMRKDIDMHAAAVILQSYLDAGNGRTS